ncbi:hypothetical protein ACFQH6_16960 [Halobacteriaceae archaeon GCM10025711]
MAAVLERTPPASAAGAFHTGAVYYTRPRAVWAAVGDDVRATIEGDGDAGRHEYRMLGARYRDRVESVRLPPGIALERYTMPTAALVDGLTAAGFREADGRANGFRLFANPGRDDGLTQAAVIGRTVLWVDPWRDRGGQYAAIRAALTALDDTTAAAALDATDRRIVAALDGVGGEARLLVPRKGGRTRAIAVTYRADDALVTEYKVEDGRLAETTGRAAKRPPFGYRDR